MTPPKTLPLDLISMIVAQSGANGKTEMMLVMIASTAAKNRRPGLSGHSPRSAVFGMDDRMDGSVIDSLLDGCGFVSLNLSLNTPLDRVERSGYPRPSA